MLSAVMRQFGYVIRVAVRFQEKYTFQRFPAVICRTILHHFCSSAVQNFYVAQFAIAIAIVRKMSSRIDVCKNELFLGRTFVIRRFFLLFS